MEGEGWADSLWPENELTLQELTAMGEIRLKVDFGWPGTSSLSPLPQVATLPRGKHGVERSGRLCLQLQGRTQTEQENVTTTHSSMASVKQAG